MPQKLPDDIFADDNLPDDIFMDDAPTPSFANVQSGGSKASPSFLDSVSSYVPEPVKAGWDVANKSFFDYAPDWMNPSKRVAERHATENATHDTSQDWDIPLTGGAKWSGLRQGVEQGAADVVTGLASPLNLATTAATMGSAPALEAGYAGAARGLNLAGRALSAPVAAHGAYEMVRPDATWGERGMGLTELAGGAAGTMQPMPIKKGSIRSIPPKIEAELGKQTAARLLELEHNANSIVKDSPAKRAAVAADPRARLRELIAKEEAGALASNELNELIALRQAGRSVDPNLAGGEGDPMLAGSAGYKHAPGGKPRKSQEERAISRIEDQIPPEMRESFATSSEPGPNASGESAASSEAMSRQEGMRSRGETYIVYDRAGVAKTLTGPEAVDYQAQPGETYGIRTPRGFVQLDNKGGNVPPQVKTIKPRTGKEYPGFKGPEPGPELGDVTGLRGRLDAVTGEVPTEGIVPEEGVKPAPPVLEPEAQALRDQTQPLPSDKGISNDMSLKPRRPGESIASDNWQAAVDELDSIGARDAEYRDILSTGGKTTLKKGETWRGKVLKYIEMDRARYEPLPKPGDTGIANEMSEGRRQTATKGNEPPKQPPIKPPDKYGLGPELPDPNPRVSTFERKYLQHEPVTPKKKPVKPEEFAGEIKDVADLAEDAKDLPKGPEKEGILRKTNNAARSLLTTWDLSAPGRQGKAFLLNKAYWTSLDDMVRAWGSEKAANTINQSIIDHPSGYFKPGVSETGKPAPSFAERMGLDLAATEEVFNKTIGDKFKKYSGINKAGRAHTAFLNKLRSDQFVAFMEASKKAGRDAEQMPAVAKQFAKFINDATGRGSLNVGKWKLERNAGTLSDVFFAPKNMSGQIRTWNQVLNPYRYYQADPIIRKQALKSLFAIAGVGMGMGELAKLAGANVSNDPTSTDFRKIVVGDTRIDLFGGYQQFPVAAMRLMLNKTTSPGQDGNEGRTTDMGAGKFGMPTRQSVAERFFTNRLSPVAAFVWAWMGNREFDGKPFEVKKALFDRVQPIAVHDMIELAQEDPKLAAILTPLLITGIAGTQTYTRE